MYIYVSNETPNIDVFFDNLQVTHIRGPILEETHYYPFGLTMAGISSKALAFGNPENKNEKFQGQPLDDDLGVNWYGFRWRNHDAQTGRFIQIDPLSEKYVYNSTYAFSENKVIRHVELEGLESVDAIGITYLTSEAYTRKIAAENGKSDADINDLIDKVNRADRNGKLVGAAIGLSFMYPGVASIIMVSELSGVPVNPSPQAMSGTARSGLSALESAGDETITLYRGVNSSSVKFEEALAGTAKPNGGNATPLEHNTSSTLSSPYTSWTTDPEVAVNFALRPSENGVVLKANVATKNTVASPNLKNVQLATTKKIVSEAEVLVNTPIRNAQAAPINITNYKDVINKLVLGGK